MSHKPLNFKLGPTTLVSGHAAFILELDGPNPSFPICARFQSGGSNNWFTGFFRTDGKFSSLESPRDLLPNNENPISVSSKMWVSPRFVSRILPIKISSHVAILEVICDEKVIAFEFDTEEDARHARQELIQRCERAQ